jgi:hypothetical protein
MYPRLPKISDGRVKTKHHRISTEKRIAVFGLIAMRWAATATCERERLEWLRIALASHNLTLAQQRRFHEAPHHRLDSVHDD